MAKKAFQSFLETVYPVYVIYTVLSSCLPPMRQLATILSITLVLAFLKFPTLPKGPPQIKPIGSMVDGILVLLSILVGAYLYVEYPELVYRVGIPTRMDVILGVIATLLVLEITRRSSGWPLVIIAICALIYTYFWAGFSINRIITLLYTTDEGILGIAFSVMVNYIVIFIMFGAIMEAIGGLGFFMKFSQVLAGRWRSGPAQLAVISSACMGTLSGSAVANVATTGSLTIPLMKRLGYEPHKAAAIESAASTGGQIMPPIMGAAAFLIAEFLGIPYLRVVKAALMPAILFFLSVGMGVYFYAEKLNLQKLSQDNLPKTKDILKEGYYLLPLICLIYFLISGITPMRAAFYAVLTAICISFFKRETWLNPKKAYVVCQKSSNNMIVISVGCACAGIIIGVVQSTGLGLKFSSMIVSAGGGSLIICLFLTMLAAIIFGMGLPSTITYILLAVLAAPALVDMGTLPLAAHLYVFFFGMMSMVTPPVAFACYAACALADSDFSKTAIEAFKLVFPSFIIAYVFIYNNSLLLEGNYLFAAWTFLLSSAGVIGVAAAIQGWFLQKNNLWETLLFFVGGLFLIIPGLLFDLIGFSFIGAGILMQVLAKSTD